MKKVGTVDRRRTQNTLRTLLWPKEQREMQRTLEWAEANDQWRIVSRDGPAEECFARPRGRLRKTSPAQREAQRAYSALYRAQGKAHRAYLRGRREALAAIHAVL
jgi:hypothetical protein